MGRGIITWILCVTMHCEEGVLCGRGGGGMYPLCIRGLCDWGGGGFIMQCPFIYNGVV